MIKSRLALINYLPYPISLVETGYPISFIESRHPLECGEILCIDVIGMEEGKK